VAAFLPPSAPASRRSARERPAPGSPTLLGPARGASSGSGAGSPPPPPLDLGGGRGGGPSTASFAASSYLHQFPRPAAHHHHNYQQQHGGGGGRAGSPTLAPFARPPSAGDLGGLQESLAQGGTAAGMQQSGLFLPGQVWKAAGTVREHAGPTDPNRP
jgi:hypothetical protein